MNESQKSLESSLMQPRDLDETILSLGRYILYFAAFCIPLAFCRETMYVFQIKTLILQYSGLLIAILVIVHQFLSKTSPSLTQKWATRFILIFLAWEIFKCWNSISPTISWRQMSRVFWFPVMAMAVPYFFQTRRHVERLITVIVASALIANILVWLMYYKTTRDFIYGAGPARPNNNSFDLVQVPLVGDFLLWLFYPNGAEPIHVKGIPFMGEFGQGRFEQNTYFPMSRMSFFPGKGDAGTFGSKNFISGYLNLTSLLMIYKGLAVSVFNKNRKWFHWAILGILVIVSLASFAHIGRLGNRGSQIGMIASFSGIVLYVAVFFKKYSNPFVFRKIVLGLVLFVSASTAIVYAANPGRFESIFSFTSTSNELRIQTWESFYNALVEDEEFPGFTNPVWRVATGFGTYAFRVIYPKYRSYRIFQIEFGAHNTESSHPHNEYMGYLGELGVIGLLLFLVMMGVLYWRLLKASSSFDAKTRLLAMAILCGITAQMAHQSVGVSVRYTGVGFQFWLSIGLLLAISAPLIPRKRREEHAGARMSTGGVLLVCVFVVMPDFSYPLQLMRSQHFYEMGQYFYTGVRALNTRVNTHKTNVENLEKKRAELKSKGMHSPELEQKLQNERKYVQHSKMDFDKKYKLADEYFEWGHDYDKANMESLYIGANMNTQFARMAFHRGDFKRAKVLYRQALNRYDRIIPVLPYFVQAKYWQAVCHEGLGLLYHKKSTELLRGLGETGKNPYQKTMKDHFEKALQKFKDYQVQDSTFREPYFEKFLIHYVYLKQKGLAYEDLVAALVNLERGGYDLFSTDRRFDSIKLINHIISMSRDTKELSHAFEIYSRLSQQKTMENLLPFVPKTQRHVKSTFEFLPVHSKQKLNLEETL